MKRIRIMIFALSAVTLIMMPQEALSWSEATHAYIADHIGKTNGLRNLNEIYGAMVPDFFNLKQFSPEYSQQQYQCVRAHTHGFIPASNDDFMAIWDEAGWGLSRNAAYAYIGHNDMWGADVAAHWDGLTNAEAEALPNPDPYPDPISEVGWVMEKARQLITYFDAQGIWTDLEIPLDPMPDPWMFQPAELFCQFLVMKAGDVVIKRNDPLIGAKIAAAALVRTPRFNEVLANAISCADSESISATELEFREQTLALGFLLLQSEEQYLDTIATQISALAPAFFEFYGIPFTPDKQEIVDYVISEGMNQALVMIEDDYMLEVNAMIVYLQAQMPQHLGFY